jgi:hypothetical protein
MVVPNQLLSKQNILKNIPTRNESRLVPTNQRVQNRDHSVRNDLCDTLINDITTSNWTKISHERSIRLLWHLKQQTRLKKLCIAATTSSPTTDQEDLKNSVVKPSEQGDLFKGMLNIVFLISSAVTGFSSKAALSADTTGEIRWVIRAANSSENPI